MTNHYHLMIETPDGNLYLGMRQLNGVYTQLFNKLHEQVICSKEDISPFSWSSLTSGLDSQGEK